MLFRDVDHYIGIYIAKCLKYCLRHLCEKHKRYTTVTLTTTDKSFVNHAGDLKEDASHPG